LGFREAVIAGDWAGTFRVGHPGVITTWLGALALPWSPSAVETCRRTQDASLPTRAGETPQEQTQRLAELGQLLFRGRVGVAIFTWLCLVALWALIRHALNSGFALVGLAMLGLDPFLLAHARFLHLDAVAALLSLLAVAGLVAAMEARQAGRRRFFLLCSGGAAGLAMLQKSPSLFLLPFAALVLGFAAFKKDDPQPRLSVLPCLIPTLYDLALWSLAAGVVYVALWPAMWANPVATLQGMLAKAVGYAQEGHESGNFFFGNLSDDPGLLFYPVALAFRMTPASLPGLGVVVVALLAPTIHRQARRMKDDQSPLNGLLPADADRQQARAPQPGGLSPGERRAAIVLLAFAVAFVAFMTTGAKKFDRYVLPTLVALDLAAALGLTALARGVWLRVGDWRGLRAQGANPGSQFALAGLVAVLQLAVALPSHPYYLTAYNPLLGGARVARQAILVGWGEGYDQVARYLNAQPDAQDIQVTVRGVSNFAPLFVGETRSVSGFRSWQSDYLVFYISNVQRHHNQDLLERYFFNPGLHPEHVVRLAGVEYAWIYGNDNWRAPLDRITQGAQPGDALITNGTSLIAKHYAGGLPRLNVFGHWGPREMVELLENLPAGVRRIWYARYPEADPQSIRDVLHRRGLLEDHETFPDVELYLYRLVDQELTPLMPAVTYAEPDQQPVLRLRAFAMGAGGLSWGRDNLVLLGWETLSRPKADYNVRLRLLGSDGYTWVEVVDPMLNQVLQPTSLWEPGARITDAHRLIPPAGAPPGLYHLQVEVLSGRGADQEAGGSELPPSALRPSGPVQIPVRVGQPARVFELDDLDLGQRVDKQLGPLTLLGVRLEAEAAIAGASLPLSLIWQVPEARPKALPLRLELRGLDGSTWGTWEGEGRWGTGLVRSGHNLPVDGEAPGGVARLFVILIDPSGRQEVEVAPVPLIAPGPHFQRPSWIQHPRSEGLGEKVKFLGYDISPATTPAVSGQPSAVVGAVNPGDTLALTLYWQAGGAISPPQKVFVHLIGPDGQIHGQQDNPPLLGRRPTDDWQPGEVLADPYLVRLEPDAPPGNYLVTIGMYDPVSGARLPAFDAGGNRLPEDRILLEQVQVGGSGGQETRE